MFQKIVELYIVMVYNVLKSFISEYKIGSDFIRFAKKQKRKLQDWWFYMNIRKHLTSSRIIISGFAGVILLGTILLCLPISSKSGNITPFSDALFTATSATCVTGLVVHDTATYWSYFGQCVILLLIQIGGLGIVTVSLALTMISGKKIGLMQRSTMQETIASPKIGGMVKLTGFILKTTFLIETIGAFSMMPIFIKDFGIKGIWLSLFHSISAFCNAGFDLMGTEMPYSSLTSYSNHAILNAIVMVLIVVGGIGFLVWDDIKQNKFHIKKYRMQSKVVFVTTAFLIIVPALYFYLYEFVGLATGERVLDSLFQSITTRTAGFNTADINSMSDVGKAVMIILMIIGGSPGSTAGGMKTTTIAILIFSAISVFRKKEDIECFKRRVPNGTVNDAAAILLMYLTLFIIGGLVISFTEKIPLGSCLFETASAIGTVGLTLGITPMLSNISRAVLIALMFFGRVGGLTIIFAALSSGQRNLSKKPLEKITVG